MEEIQMGQMITRSQARRLAKSNLEDTGTKKEEVAKNKKARKEKKKEGKQTGSDRKKPMKNEHNEFMSPDCPITQTKTSIREPPVSINPCITVSRGKENAHKEYEARRKLGKPFSPNKDVSHSSNRKTEAAYFKRHLSNQISRLQELCDQWNKYKVEENPPEEAISVINAAIGQTNLLITNKFVQFKSLIEIFQKGNAKTSVTCEDLHGFWDMIYIQVNNLDERFEHLQKLRSNNWREFVQDMKSEKSVTKKKHEILHNTEGENCIEKKTLRNRTNSLMLRKKSAKISQRNGSPGLMMMKVAQFAEVDARTRNILKGGVQKSTRTQRKTVLR